MALSLASSDEEVMSTINITPFTDVLLVLLIIFIILAAVTKEPKLPDALNRTRVTPSEIVVMISAEDAKNNTVEIGSSSVNIRDAHAQFVSLENSIGRSQKSVIIKADPTATYGMILQVMDAAQSAGLDTFGLANHIQSSAQRSH
ncbi:MAG TPA: biopolymer transporter ExbD [Candidatus Tyrphobacter sp.]